MLFESSIHRNLPYRRQGNEFKEIREFNEISCITFVEDLDKGTITF